MTKLPREFFQLVTKVTVVRLLGGTDHIMLEIPSLPSPYPEISESYTTNFTVEVRRGLAEEWLTAIGYTGDLSVVGPASKV
jgi:hypothetical protein